VETKRWEWLDTVEGVAAPEVAEEGASPAQLDASLRALLALRTRWDALLGHLGLLVRRYWLWREAGFASFGHYCRDRLGLGLRSVEQRIALERRLYGLPPALRAALAEGRLSLERARLVARVATEFTFEAWMTHARGRTCLALRREVMALEEAGAFASLPPGVAGDGPLSTRPEGGVGHRAAAVTGLAASVECVEADSQVRAAGDGGAGAAPLAPPQPPTAQVCAPGAADGSPPATAQLCAPGVATDATPAPSPRCTRCDEAMPAGARKALPGTAQVCAPCAREVAEAAASRRWTVHDNPPEPSLTQQPLPPWQAPPPPPRVRLLEVEGAAPQQWTAQLWEPPTRDGKRELRLRVPVPVASLLAAAFEAVRQAEGRRLSDSDCLERVAAHFLEAWGALPPVKRTPQRRALLRDGHRCQVPGCSRAAVHAHHIVYRAHGGSDGPDNLVSLCAAHHLHGVHRGWVRVRGVAPDGLTWELGERG
jgi:hypothetical protein